MLMEDAPLVGEGFKAFMAVAPTDAAVICPSEGKPMVVKMYSAVVDASITGLRAGEDIVRIFLAFAVDVI